jgi:hypothetical protein
MTDGFRGHKWPTDLCKDQTARRWTVENGFRRRWPTPSVCLVSVCPQILLHGYVYPALWIAAKLAHEPNRVPSFSVHIERQLPDVYVYVAGLRVVTSFSQSQKSEYDSQELARCACLHQHTKLFYLLAYTHICTHTHKPDPAPLFIWRAQ